MKLSLFLILYIELDIWLGFLWFICIGFLVFYLELTQLSQNQIYQFAKIYTLKFVLVWVFFIEILLVHVIVLKNQLVSINSTTESENERLGYIKVLGDYSFENPNGQNSPCQGPVPDRKSRKSIDSHFYLRYKLKAHKGNYPLTRIHHWF